MLSERLARARKRVGLSQRQLAAAMGGRYDQTMISHVETGRSGLVGEGLTKAATILGVSIDYLFGLTDDPTPTAQLTPATGLHASEMLDIALIPRVASVVGSETAIKEYDATILERLPFSHSWLAEHRIDPDNCHLIKVQGDLMEPTIPDGCSILVDVSVQQFKDDGIFLLQFQQRIIERTLKYLTPVRLTLDSSIYDGVDYRDWYISFDKDNKFRWPLSLYDVTNIIGEVLMVLTVPKSRQ